MVDGSMANRLLTSGDCDDDDDDDEDEGIRVWDEGWSPCTTVDAEDEEDEEEEDWCGEEAKPLTTRSAKASIPLADGGITASNAAAAAAAADRAVDDAEEEEAPVPRTSVPTGVVVASTLSSLPEFLNPPPPTAKCVVCHRRARTVWGCCAVQEYEGHAVAEKEQEGEEEEGVKEES